MFHQHQMNQHHGQNPNLYNKEDQNENIGQGTAIQELKAKTIDTQMRSYEAQTICTEQR